jgi:hypothetical protein
LSHIRCFFCGKDSAISGFEPSDLDLDIYIRQVYGLGYGGGFEFGPDESVLGDEYFTSKFLDRSIDFINLLIEKGLISKEEIERRLKLGIPIINLEGVLPYDSFINIQENEIRILENQVSKLKSQNTFSGQNYVTKDSYDGLEKRYDEFRREYGLKKLIDDVLIDLHNNSDSKIIKGKDDWSLEIYDINPVIHNYLYRQLYRMKLYERNMLEERIKTNCYGINVLFNVMRKEPTIKSIHDVILKKPNLVYYTIPGHPIPRDYTANIFHRKTNRETYP